MDNNKKSLKDQIYSKILTKIVNGEYPHDQFLTESNLTGEFGVSRILVREALIELRKDNILKSIPRAGYQILQLTGKEIQDAIRTRAILEAGAASCALDLISPEILSELEKLVAEADNALRTGKQSLTQWWNRNVKFHGIIAEATGNSLLIDMIDRTTSIIWRACVQYFTIRDPDSYHDFQPGSHKDILDAIRRRDEENFVMLMKADAASMSSLFRID